MFTSRAEFRLSLRADNADERLTPLAQSLGIVGKDRQVRFAARIEAYEACVALARSLTLTPNEARGHGLNVNMDGIRRSAFDLLSHPDVGRAEIVAVWPELRQFDDATLERLKKCALRSLSGSATADVAQIKREEARTIPGELDFSAVAGLSNELKQKMLARRPTSIAEAQRLDGMTPAALSLIIAHIRNFETANLRGAA
jgi:tRNA uridine 5-carboxymethylaminomethyl modification enzyme